VAPPKKRLLVVEDEEAIRESLVLGLSDYGWDVTEACDSHAALEFDTPFDIYLIDMQLPDQDGIELGRLIGKRFGKVPIVLLTGYLNGQLQDMADKNNISLVLRKPFRFEELDRALKALVRPRKAR